MNYYLGVDVGNTKSHALIADGTGRCIGFGAVGPGSWEAIGWDGARAALHELVDRAAADAGIGRRDITAAGFGYAGYDWPEDRPGHVAMIESLGMEAPFALGNDTLVGLVAGARQGWGVVVVAGTSNNCRGRDRHGREGRIAGAGFIKGEFGGAFEIVMKAGEAVSAAWSRRGPRTALADAFVAYTGATDVTDMLAGIARDRYHLSAAAAPLVFEVAARGDRVAQNVITWAGRELGNLAAGVIRQLDLMDETFDVVLSGSIYTAGAPIIEPLRETIHAVAPGAALVRLTAPPVVGGVLLAMERGGLDIPTYRDAVSRTAAALIG